MRTLMLKVVSLFVLILFAMNHSVVFSKPNSNVRRDSGFDLSADNVGLTSASFQWGYPENFEFSDGDYITLILYDSENGYRGEKSVFSACHGKDKTDLSDVTSFDASNLFSGVSYNAKLDLITTVGDIYTTECNFETSELNIHDISIEGEQDGAVSNKNVKISWSTDPADLTFAKGDKVELFMKQLSDNDFPKVPVFMSNENVKSADIVLPVYEGMYDFKIVYSLGKNRLSSDWFYLDLKSGGVEATIDEIKSATAKLTLAYTHEDALGESSQVDVFIKSEKEDEYSKTPIISLKGKEQILSNKEHVLNKLKFSTKYNVKIKFIVETFSEFGKENNAVIYSEHEFETKKFDIKDLKCTDGNENKVKLTWDFDGENISFSEGDSLSVYIKESLEDKYSENILKDVSITSEELMNKKEVEITFPKYDTKYDVRLIYSVGGKNLCKYITHTVTLPKIDFGVKVLSEDSLKFKLSFDQTKTKFETSEQDKIEIFAKEHGKEGQEYKKIDFTTEEVSEEDKVEEEAGKASQKSLTKDGTDNSQESSTSEQNIITKQLKIEGLSTKINGEASSVSRLSREGDGHQEPEQSDEAQASEDQQQDPSTSGGMGSGSQGGGSGSPGEGVSPPPPENDGMVSDEEISNGKEETPIVKQTLPKVYDFKIVVTKDGALFQEEFYRVLMEKDVLQITNIDYKKLDEKKVEATVLYAPYDFDFTLVESLSYKKEKDTESSSQTKTKEKSENETIIISNDLKTKNKFEITFDDFSKYKLTFTYKMKYNILPSFPSEEQKEAQSDSVESETDSVPGYYFNKVEREDIYDNKFDVFNLELRDDIFNEIKLNLGFEKYYTPKDGDKVEIFFKVDGTNNGESQGSTETRDDNDGFSKDPLVTFVQEKDKVNLADLGSIDLAGLDAGTTYVFKGKFTPKDSSNVIEKEKKASTKDLVINDVVAEHISDIGVYIKWKLGDGVEFGPNDTLDIYYKAEGSEYPAEPSEHITDLYLTDGVIIYLDTIDTNYKIKLKFKSGSKTYEKEIDFNLNIDDLNAEMGEVYETSAYVKWGYPANYSITDGESISIYVKKKNSEYDEEPDYYMEQNSEDGQYIEDFKSIKLTSLFPKTEYDVKLVLDFGEVGKKEKELSFSTKDVSISELALKSIRTLDFEIGWEIDSSILDFEEGIDYLNIYKKLSDEEFSEDKLVYTIENGIENFDGVRITADDPEATYDIKIEYKFLSGSIDRTISGGLFSISFDESSNLILNYPSSLVFENGDFIQILLKDVDGDEYEEIAKLKQSSSNDLNGLKEIELEGLSQGSLVMVNIGSSNTQVFPAVTSYGEPEVPVLEIVSELSGNWVDIHVPDEYNVDTSSEVLNSIGGESYYDQLEDGSNVIVIDRLVPKKVYTDAFVITSDMDGNEVRFNLGEFSLEPADLLEDFLYNSYYFAFERDPDEGGYNYWKDELEENENMSGKYFLINLMFAEREFADRNLSDEDLIKVLYQIVVNREYDSQGLSYWMALYSEYLKKFNGDKYEAKKTIVLRMAYEPEFGRLCDEMGIPW